MVGLEVNPHPPAILPPVFALCVVRFALFFPTNHRNRFEYRRNMQEVLPGVFLGPLQIARVNSTLHANKITLLVPVRTKDTARFLSIPNDEDGQVWQSFPVDIQYDQIMTWFYRTYLRVKEEVDKGGRAFIYCENGNGLSAAMCVALVMDSKLCIPDLPFPLLGRSS